MAKRIGGSGHVETGMIEPTAPVVMAQYRQAAHSEHRVHAVVPDGKPFQKGRKQMNMETQNGSGKSWLWLAGAVGAAAGVATLVYSRKPRSRWEGVRDTVIQGAAQARRQVKPWMGATAGVAAGCATMAYRRARRRPSFWEQALSRVGKVYPGMKRLMA